MLFTFLQKKTKRAKALRESTSIDQTDKEKYAELMAVAYMSSEESLSEPESEGHGGEISGSMMTSQTRNAYVYGHFLGEAMR